MIRFIIITTLGNEYHTDMYYWGVDNQLRFNQGNGTAGIDKSRVEKIITLIIAEYDMTNMLDTFKRR